MLVPFALFPALMMAQGNIPLRVILRKMLFVLPFAVAIGVFNPIFDRDVLLKLGTLEISAGWISCAQIVTKIAPSAAWRGTGRFVRLILAC